jgi:hypothetical protein
MPLAEGEVTGEFAGQVHALRVREAVRVSVGGPDVDQDCLPGWDVTARQFLVDQCGAHQEFRRPVQPEEFLDRPGRVGSARKRGIC